MSVEINSIEGASELTEQVTDIEAQASAIVVKCEHSLEEANDLLGPVKALIKQADAIFDPIIAAGLKAHRTALAQKRIVTDPLDRAEKTIKKGISSYMAEVKRRKAEEQRKADELARKQAEEERLAAALRMEEAGNVEAADAILEAPVVTPVIVRSEKPVMPKGLSSRTIWKARVTDPFSLIAYIATHSELLYLVSFSQKDLDSMAKKQHELLNLPGVEAYSEESIARR